MYVSCYVQFHLPKDEIDAAKSSNGFVYLQDKPSVNNKNLPFLTLKECIQYLRRVCKINVPIYCGVGIHAPQDVQMVKEASGDGVFIGSTILKLYNNIPDIKSKIQEFKDECR